MAAVVSVGQVCAGAKGIPCEIKKLRATQGVCSDGRFRCNKCKDKFERAAAKQEKKAAQQAIAEKTAGEVNSMLVLAEAVIDADIDYEARALEFDAQIDNIKDIGAARPPSIVEFCKEIGYNADVIGLMNITQYISSHGDRKLFHVSDDMLTRIFSSSEAHENKRMFKEIVEGIPSLKHGRDYVILTANEVRNLVSHFRYVTPFVGHDPAKTSGSESRQDSIDKSRAGSDPLNFSESKDQRGDISIDAIAKIINPDNFNADMLVDHRSTYQYIFINWRGFNYTIMDARTIKSLILKGLYIELPNVFHRHTRHINKYIAKQEQEISKLEIARRDQAIEQQKIAMAAKDEQLARQQAELDVEIKKRAQYSMDMKKQAEKIELRVTKEWIYVQVTPSEVRRGICKVGRCDNPAARLRQFNTGLGQENAPYFAHLYPCHNAQYLEDVISKKMGPLREEHRHEMYRGSAAFIVRWVKTICEMDGRIDDEINEHMKNEYIRSLGNDLSLPPPCDYVAAINEARAKRELLIVHDRERDQSRDNSVIIGPIAGATSLLGALIAEPIIPEDDQTPTRRGTKEFALSNFVARYRPTPGCVEITWAAVKADARKSLKRHYPVEKIKGDCSRQLRADLGAAYASAGINLI